METMFVHRGRAIGTGDIAFIRDLIERYPDEHRTSLSRKICLAWNWVQPNGQPKDMVCRGLLLHLEQHGLIKLPPKRRRTGGWHIARNAPQLIEVDQTPIETNLKELHPIVLRQVRRTQFEQLYNGLIAQFHYLGYAQPVGSHLKYIAFSNERPIACFAWSSAPRHIGCRDRYIGWDGETRRNNLHLLAYNTRFLLPPWVSVPHLASYLLAKMAGRISRDWQEIYGHPLYFLETFVDTVRFKGTCYRAANWIYMGKTTGRGKDDLTHQPNRSLKAVWGYPLRRDFKQRLCGG
jgi:hypothetical protein